MEKVIAGGISERMILATFVFIIILAFVFVGRLGVPRMHAVASP